RGAGGPDDRALQVPGQIEADPQRVAVVSSRIAGQLDQLFVVEGDRVDAGRSVATLFSSEFLTAQSDVQLAERRAVVLRGSPDEAGARALADAAARRLRLLGSTEADVAALRRGDPPASTLPLRAPLAGSIVRAHVLAGEALAAGAPVFTVADLTVVDVVAEIPEVSLSMVRIGQAAAITIAAFPALRLRGTVELLREQLNPDTRTVRAVIHVGNPTRVLRPGMYASVWIDVGSRSPGALATPGLLVPATALVNDGVERIVFVEVAPRTYERRVVRVESLSPEGSLRPTGRDVRIADGLRAGERVVTHGAFLLKSELNKSSDPEDE
ncbi:MAG: efflux RND transporter periplasmic adaptor subunit, partial [Gemmatimonadaceae bacterium]